MHVLQLVPTLRVGGVERGVLDLAKGLMARGHRVSVISAGGPLVKPLVALGAAHHELPVHEKSPVTMLSSIPRVVSIIRSTGVDLVHARSRIPAWIGWAAARASLRPFVTTAHGFYRPHVGSRIMVQGRLVIAPSEVLGRYLVDRLHLPRERLRIIPRGVDLAAFQFQAPVVLEGRPWRIGLFGRLSPIKGHDVAVRACARLIRQGLPVRLCIVGDEPGSPRRKTLEALIAHCELQGAVEWLGVREDVPAVIASMDLVMVPSTYPESFGRGVIEAQAVGRPVVASRIGALAELVNDGETGLLVHPGDPQALADALSRMIADAGLRQRCVAAGRRQVETHCHVEQMVEGTLAVYEECLTRPRILMWKLSAMGDVILATPSLRAIRRQFPQAHIALAVGRSAYEIVARCPHLNDILIYDPKRKDRGVLGQLAFARRLRRERFDLSIDLQNSRQTHLLAWLAGIAVRVGYRRRYGWLLNRGVRLPRVVLAPIAHQHYLLRQAGLAPDGDALELWPSALDEQAADRLLAAPASNGEPQPMVGLHPGGSGRWKTKRWDLERWAALCNALIQRNIRVVITGGPQERGLADALRRHLSSSPLMLIGQTSMMELACVIKRCAAFVAHDSSPLHLAAAVGTPAIALFGPTDPARHLPPAFRGQVMYKKVFCSPCYATTCRTITHACMKKISVEEVFAAIVGLIADRDLSEQPDAPAGPVHRPDVDGAGRG